MDPAFTESLIADQRAPSRVCTKDISVKKNGYYGIVAFTGRDQGRLT